jgi:uncharacterized membrane protein YgaE (UPF0421/DUF939 family)
MKPLTFFYLLAAFICALVYSAIEFRHGMTYLCMWFVGLSVGFLVVGIFPSPKDRLSHWSDELRGTFEGGEL